MVGILEIQRKQKEEKLLHIGNLILKCAEGKKKNEGISWNDCLIRVMNNFSVGRATAKDYILIVLNRKNLKREEVFK